MSNALFSIASESVSERGLDNPDALVAIFDGFSGGLPVLLLAIMGYALLRLHKVKAMRYLLIWFVATVGFILLMNTVADFLFHIRHAIPLLPVLLLFVAVVADDLVKRVPVVGYVLIVLWIGVSALQFVRGDYMMTLPNHVEDIPAAFMDQVHETLDACTSPDDPVFFQLTSQAHEGVQEIPIHHYLRNIHQRYAQIGRMYNLYDPGIFLPATDEDLPESYAVRLDLFTADSSRAWLFRLDGVAAHPLESEFAQMISIRYTFCEKITEDASLVDIYAFSEVPTITCDGRTIRLRDCESVDLLVR